MVGTRSIATAQLLVFLVGLIMLIQIWLDNRMRYMGIGQWIIGLAMTMAGFVLIALRGIICDFLSIIIANSLLLVGILFFLSGLNSFLKIKQNYKVNSILVIVSMSMLLYFTYVRASVSIRIIVISAAYIIFFAQALGILIKKPSGEFRSIVLSLKVNAILFIFLNFVRIAKEIFNPSQTLDYFSQNIFEIIFFTLNILVLLYLIVNLAMLIPKKLLEDVKKEERKFNTIFHQAPYGVILLKADNGAILEVNNEMLDMMKYTEDEVVGKTAIEDKFWVDLAQRAKIIEDVKAGKEVNGLEIEFKNKNGESVYGLFSAALMRLGGEDIIISTLKDIGEIKKLKEQLQNMAMRDALTQLPNRMHFYDYFEKQVARVARTREELAIVMADIDSFKTVNDEYGHDIGDKVLITVANKLDKFVRKCDMAARFGGDEFVILLNAKNRDEAKKALGRLNQSLVKPFSTDKITHHITLSIGVAMYPADGTEIDELLKKADTAMMEVKKSGKGAVKFTAE